MEDRIGRKIEYLRLSVTDLCNYRCVYCMGEEGVCKKAHSDILSLEELAEIAQAAVRCGVKKIRLTGGEPLLRPGIMSLCRMLRGVEGLEELTLTTNGAALPRMAADLKAAGVDTDRIDERVVARYPEIRNLLYEYLMDNGSIDPEVIGNPAVIGKWEFIPEKLARPALEQDMALLFKK